MEDDPAPVELDAVPVRRHEEWQCAEDGVAAHQQQRLQRAAQGIILAVFQGAEEVSAKHEGPVAQLATGEGGRIAALLGLDEANDSGQDLLVSREEGGGALLRRL